MVETTSLLTLARLYRQTYLLDKEGNHVVIVTQYGLREGASEAEVETRRAVHVKGEYKDGAEVNNNKGCGSEDPNFNYKGTTLP